MSLDAFWMLPKWAALTVLAVGGALVLLFIGLVGTLVSMGLDAMR